MTTTRRPLTVLAVTAFVAGLTACTGDGGVGGAASDAAGAIVAPGAVAAAADDRAVPVVRAPDVDCAGLEPLLGPLLDGLVLDHDAGSAPDGAVSCGWGPGSDDATDDDAAAGPVLRVEIAPASQDVPDVAEDAGPDDEGYRTDSRLDPYDGVVLWRPLEQNIVGGAAGAVAVPGLEIVVSSAGYPRDAGLDLDTLVTFAVEVLELSAV